MRSIKWMALAAVVLVGANARAARAEAPWLEASSEHFVIYAQDSQRDITRFSQQLERYHSGMALLLSSTAPVPSPSNRVTVYVVRSESKVRELYGEGSKYVGGFYVPRAGGSLAIVPAVTSANGVANWSRVVLLHEYAHHFLSSSNPMAMPRWSVASRSPGRFARIASEPAIACPMSARARGLSEVWNAAVVSSSRGVSALAAAGEAMAIAARAIID